MSQVAVAHGSVAFEAPLERRFYSRMAWGFLAVGLVGFAPTYWVPLLRGTLQVQPLTHVHAFVFYGWLLLFCGQATLVATGRTTRHREMGVVGVSVATAMLFVGIAVAIQTIRQQEAGGGVNAASRAFSIVPITGVLLFAALVGVAVANVKRSDVHKRLMLVATASILQAGVARWFILFLAPPRPAGAVGPPPPPPVAVTLGPTTLLVLFLAALMLHDRRKLGRVHPAYWGAGAAVIAVQVLRIPVAGTDAWLRVTHWLLALAP